MNSNGLNSGDLWAFKEMCIKANTEQLCAMKEHIEGCIDTRINSTLVTMQSDYVTENEDY